MDPDKIEATLERASRLLEIGKPAQALRALAPLRGCLFDPEDRIEAETLKAWALSELGRDREALSTLGPMIDEFPESSRLFGTLGIVFSNAHQLSKARLALERAVELDEGDETSLANLALVYEKLRDYRGAIAMYERALSQGADLDWALPRIAAVQGDMGQSAAARATLHRYLSIAPDDASQWVMLGILYSDEERYEEAFDAYRHAEKIDPASPVLHMNWGVTAVHARNLDLARQQYQRLQRVEPDGARARLLHAFLLEEEGQVRAAQNCYEELLDICGQQDDGELAYILEMAMDFFARRDMRERCADLMQRAYHANACTVELCDAYRDVFGRPCRNANWFSLLLEADFRDSPANNPTTEHLQHARPRKYARHFQVIAPDRDEAVSIAREFAEAMGETGVRLRAIAHEERVTDERTGIYEVDAESLVYVGQQPG